MSRSIFQQLMRSPPAAHPTFGPGRCHQRLSGFHSFISDVSKPVPIGLLNIGKASREGTFLV